MEVMEANHGALLKFEHTRQIRDREMQHIPVLIGQTRRDIHSTMTLTNEEKDKIEILFKMFEEHCLAQQNVTMEQYRFHMWLVNL